MIPITDISRWQGAVDFEVMASRNVQGVIIRCSNGKAIDPMIATYMPAAKAAGLKVGVYGFVNPRSCDSWTAAEIMVAAHKRWDCDIPPMLDVENYLLEPGSLPVLKGPAFAAYIRTMTIILETDTRAPIIYTNRAYWDPWVGDATFGRFDNIIARYPWYSVASAAGNTPPLDASKWGEWLLARTTSRPQVPTGWDGWTAWQFSAGYNKRGHFYGCSSTDLDLNIVKPDVWERWIGRPPVIEPERPIERPPVIEQPVEVGEDEDVSIATNAEQRDMGDGREGGWPVGWIKWAVVFNPSAGRFEKLHIDGNVYNGISGGRENSLANAALDAIPDYQVVGGGGAVPLNIVLDIATVPGRATGTAQPA